MEESFTGKGTALTQRLVVISGFVGTYKSLDFYNIINLWTINTVVIYVWSVKAALQSGHPGQCAHMVTKVLQPLSVAFPGLIHSSVRLELELNIHEELVITTHCRFGAKQCLDDLFTSIQIADLVKYLPSLLHHCDRSDIACDP